MMFRAGILKIACLAAFAALAAAVAFPQEGSALKPPPYRGVSETVGGVFVTSVAGAPLTAVVVVENTKALAGGAADVMKTTENIARDSRGRIYNERRQMVSPSFTGTPRLLSFHLFDPETRLNTFLDPATRIARQTKRPEQARVAEAEAGPTVAARHPLVAEEDLGTETMEGVLVHGLRRVRTVPATASGTGDALAVTDEIWYSEELHLNMLVEHDDPRSGHQTVTVTQVNRTEPGEAIFQIPAGYKVVDETPER